jgi:hypothetical protein
MVASETEAVWTNIETAIAGSLATDGQSTMSGNRMFWETRPK